MVNSDELVECPSCNGSGFSVIDWEAELERQCTFCTGKGMVSPAKANMAVIEKVSRRVQDAMERQSQQAESLREKGELVMTHGEYFSQSMSSDGDLLSKVRSMEHRLEEYQDYLDKLDGD